MLIYFKIHFNINKLKQFFLIFLTLSLYDEFNFECFNKIKISRKNIFKYFLIAFLLTFII